MKKPSSFLPFLASILMSSALIVQPAYAVQLDPDTILKIDLRLQDTDEDNFGLGSGQKNVNSLSTEARFRLTKNFNEDSLFYWEGRGVASLGDGVFQSSDTGALSNNKSFLEWRQSYLQFNNISESPAYIKLGRQRIREAYGVWWNHDFDAIQAGYDSTVFKGSITGGQNLASYNTSGSDFKNNDKDIARLIGEGSWQYYYQQFFEARMMLQNDHSGIAPIGAVEANDNRNDTDGTLVWGGIRAAGKARSFLKGADKIAYRADLMAVSGNESFDTVAVNTPTTVIVTATGKHHVMGWGIDTGIDVPLPASYKPELHLGYAFGSGDSNPGSGTDNAFRQTGLNGNVSRIGALSENSDIYGSVLRPDLSNIHIVSAGFTRPVLIASDAGIIYRYYRLSQAATSLPSSRINGTLNGKDLDLGNGIDIFFNMDMMKELNWSFKNAEGIGLRSSLGVFRTGSAYGTNSGEIAARGLAELRVNF